MNSSYSDRKNVVLAVFILVGTIFLIRLLFLQVLDTSARDSADNNSQRHVTQYPSRGLVYDRNGVLLVDNVAAYDLMVIPRRLKEFDTLELCQAINISKSELKQGISAAKAYSYRKPSIVVKQLSSEVYAVLQEKLYKFQGFSVQTRTLRKYQKPIAAHLLGYVGEVNDQDIKNNSYYVSGDYIGISGIEKTYEEELRGKKGVKIYRVDVHSTIQGSYKEGLYDRPAEAGKEITISLDAALQEYGEYLMQNKRGSIVAIEPSTGEILAIISSPSYDPNLLVGRARSKNFTVLSLDSIKPLFNRALMAKYPPGSTFKVINALIALQEEIITPENRFPCYNGYSVGSFHMSCHHSDNFDLVSSIQYSCNAYYAHVYRKLLDDNKFINISDAYNHWRNHLLSFGLSSDLNSDIPNVLKGFIPTKSYFDKYYGENRWKSLMLVSMAIGQGELGITPFQLANLAAAVANRGYYYTPHIIKSIAGEKIINSRFLEKHYTTIDQKYFEPVVEGMEKVVLAGTATSAKVDGISICGKTGTAQNPHGENHSIFMAFAPKDNPKIAISVYVENAGYGSTWAAPIASLMIEKYLNDSINHTYMRKYWEDKVINSNFMYETEIKR